MFEERVNFVDFEKEAKKRKVKETFQKYVVNPVKTGVKWGAEHPVEALSLLTLTAGVTKKALNVKKERIEQRRRDCDFYDPRMGKHCESKRKLSNREMMEVEKRYRDNKESYRSILYDMGLLK